MNTQTHAVISTVNVTNLETFAAEPVAAKSSSAGNSSRVSLLYCTRVDK